MDRIKYHRVLPVYLSYMQSLKEKDPNTWQFFVDENFPFQINYVILGTDAEVVDHADELAQKKKIQGSLMGITIQDNSKNIVFLNITCGFRNSERTIGNFSFRKERCEFTMHQIKIV